jgi:hypothetical protein
VYGGKLAIRKGRIVGFQPKRDPKAWKSLANKSADVIVGKLKLLKFLMILGASHDLGTELITWQLTGFHRNSKKNVYMLVDAEDKFVDVEGMGAQNAKAQKIAGDAYVFPLSTRVSVQVPEAAKNVLFQSEEEMFAKAPELERKARAVQRVSQRRRWR